ncbi:type II secretion system F family protein [Clostridium omnivorum]|uniref:Secretion system protein n=1 Tax=Clostridium omnivorum TaxID=1604902 RepID=A0ABQ5N1C0_9CLOT|nr:type II secretion system F family protein [Clostridium sp. E14]GLC28989.1 secretion system protein [Clostridium sp. E14]
MKDIILLLYFLCSFMLVFGILYIFILQDKKLEKRVKYYLDINEKYKKSKSKTNKEQIKFVDLKNIYQFIRAKTSEETSEKLQQILRSSGIQMDIEEYIVLVIISMVFLGVASALLLKNFIFVIPGVVVGYIIPRYWLSGKRKKRIKEFNEALPDMIMTIVGSLKAGLSFAQAMKTVAEECESPVKEEITDFLKEMNYGITMEDALNNLKTRMPSSDLDIMIQAILIQRQVGGNLSMILEIIVKTIRERNEVERHVQSLSAQGKLSGKVVGFLPIALFVVLSLINPEYMAPFTKNLFGKIALGIGAFFMIIGFIMINKLSKIEV